MSLSSRNGLTLRAKLSTDSLEPFAPSSKYLNIRGAANKTLIFTPQKRFEQFG